MMTLRMPPDLEPRDVQQWIASGYFLVEFEGIRHLCIDSGNYSGEGCWFRLVDGTLRDGALSDVVLDWPVMGWINGTGGALHVSRSMRAGRRTYSRAVTLEALETHAPRSGDEAMGPETMHVGQLRHLFFPKYPSNVEELVSMSNKNGSVALSSTACINNTILYVGLRQVARVNVAGGTLSIVGPVRGYSYSLKPALRAAERLNRGTYGNSI